MGRVGRAWGGRGWARGPESFRLPRGGGLVGILLLAPAVGLLVARLEISVALLVSAAFFLFLVLLWSADVALFLLVFSMLLSPEFIVGDLVGQGTLGRGITVRFDDLLIVIVGLGWLGLMAVKNELGLLRKTPLNVPILAYIGACALSTALGILAGRVVPLTGLLFVLKYFEFTVVYFLVVNYVRTPKKARQVLYAALLTAAIIAAVAALQIPSGARVTAPFEGAGGEPGTLGGYLVLMIAIGLGFLTNSRALSRLLLWGSFVALLCVPLLYTFSRTSWAAFVAMLVAMIVVSRRKTVLLSVAAAVSVVLLVGLPQRAVERLMYTVSAPQPLQAMEIGGYRIEPSTAARIEAWLSVLKEAPLHPVFGYGVTGFGFTDSQYARQIMETGALGTLALAWLLWRLLLVGWRLRSRAAGPFESALGAGFLAGLVGLLVHGLGANTFIIVRIMEPFWLLAALVVALGSGDWQQGSPAGSGNPEPATPSPAPSDPRRAQVPDLRPAPTGP